MTRGHLPTVEADIARVLAMHGFTPLLYARIAGLVRDHRDAFIDAIDEERSARRAQARKLDDLCVITAVLNGYQRRDGARPSAYRQPASTEVSA